MEELIKIDTYRFLVEELKNLQDLKDKNRLLTDDNNQLRNNLFDLESELKKLQEQKEIFCRNCKQKTEHLQISKKIKRQEIGEDYDDEGDYVEITIIRYECCGCKTEITLEETQDKEGKVIEKKWIPKHEKWFLEPKESIIRNLNDSSTDEKYLKETYENTIKCFNNKMEKQCAMSVRTLIEEIGIVAGIKAELVSEGKNERNVRIEDMVNRMIDKGMITTKMATIIKELRFLGNEATHSLEKPPMKELELAILIIEHIVENIYVIEKIYNQLKSQSDTRRSTR